MPRHLCRILNVRISSFLWQAYTLPVLLCAPTVVALLLVRRWFFAQTYWEVGLQILIGLAPYAAGIGWTVSRGNIWKVEGIRVQDELKPLDTALIEAPLEKP
jgi:hypothetical protein